MTSVFLIVNVFFQYCAGIGLDLVFVLERYRAELNVIVPNSVVELELGFHFRHLICRKSGIAEGYLTGTLIADEKLIVARLADKIYNACRDESGGKDAYQKYIDAFFLIGLLNF